jgi:drug/metabolite transporter (DMT)-like permease
METAKQHRATSLLFLHLAVLLFGLSGLLGKLIPASALTVTFGRSALAALTLALVIRGKQGRWALSGLGGVWPVTLAGLLLAVHWVTFFLAVKESTIAIGLLAFSTFPMFVTLLEPCFVGGRWQRMDLGVALRVTVGLILVVPEYRFGSHLFRGACWGVVSALTFALLSLWNQRQVHRAGALALACGQNAVAAVLLLPFVAAERVVLSPWEWAGLGFLGIVCTAVAHAAFIRSLAGVRAHVAGVVTALEPVYGIVFAAVLLGEIPSPRTIGGGLIILSVAVGVSRKSGSRISK